MTREQAKQQLINLGIAEPTDEQVSNLLNTIGAETKKEKDRADGYKKEADRTAELQAQLDALNEANMTEVEKANKATELANSKIADLESQLAKMKLVGDLATIGITGDDANKIIEAQSSGDLTSMISAFGGVISARETASANAKEQELLNRTPNPMGGQGSNGDDKSSAEKLVSQLFANKTEGADNSALSHYINQ